MHFVRMTVLMALLWTGTALAASDESNRIDGVAQFLIDRANDNYLYIFEKKIRDSESFKCYFPNTRANLDVGGLKELLYSHGLWADSIDRDLNILATRSVAASLEKKLALSQRAIDLANVVVTSFQGLAVEYKGQPYPLDSIPLNADSELRALINGFYTPFTALSQALEEFKKYGGTDVCTMPDQDLDQLKQVTDALIRLPDTLEKFSAYLQRHSKDVVITANSATICSALGLKTDCGVDPEFGRLFALAMASRVTEAVGQQTVLAVARGTNAVQDVIETYQRAGTTTTTKVAAALRLIDTTGNLTQGEFGNLSRYIMFFAQISDSTSSEQVKDLLASYTLPSVSFYTKRQYGWHWMITAYLGASDGWVHPKPSAGESNNAGGIFAPVGLELSYGTKDCGSLSLMLSPFDFGYPVSLKLNGVQDEAKLNDIIAPTLSLSYGMREYPIVFGLAYQRGRIVQATGQQETRIMVFAAFDMPLFGLN